MTEKATTKTKTERSKRIFFQAWAIIGVVIILIGCGYALGQVGLAISIILFSAFLVFVLRAPVAWMERKRIPRALGVIISYLLTLIVIGLILLIFLPIIIGQVVSFASTLPSYVSDIRAIWDNLYELSSGVLEGSIVHQLIQIATTELSRWATTAASESAKLIVAFSTGLINTLIVIGVSFIVGFWVLKDLPQIGKELMIIAGPRFSGDVQFIASSCSRALGGYLKGMGLAAICVGTMAGICYYIIGLPYPVVLGLLTGLMNFIPFLGPWIAGTVVALLGFFVSPVTALLAIALTIMVQMFVDNFVVPRVMSGAVDLHPGVVLIVLIAGGAIGGIFGILCAIPLTAAAKTIFVYYFERKTGRKISSPFGAIFRGRPEQEADTPDETSDPDPIDTSDSSAATGLVDDPDATIQ